MLNASQFPAVRQAWSEIARDRQISPRELQAVRQQLQEAAPELSEDAIRAQLAQLLSETQSDLSPEQAQAVLEHVFQGDTLDMEAGMLRHAGEPQAVRFFEDAPAAEPHEVHIRVSEASLTDSNGVRTVAADDLSGNIGEISLQTAANSQQMEAVLDSVTRQLASQIAQTMGGDQDNPGVMQQIMQEAAEHIDVAPRTVDGQTVFDFNLDPAFREQLTGLASAGVTVNGWLEAVGLNPYDFSNPLATLSTRDGQLTLDLPNESVAEHLTGPETRVPDFGSAPATEALPANAPPADEAQVREILENIDWPGNDPRRQSQLISGDRDQRQLMNLYNQGALESLPPELHERAAFWASETAALDVERLLHNWYGNDSGQNTALQQVISSPAFQSLPAERRDAIIQQGAQTGAEILAGQSPLSEDQQSLLATLSPHLQPWEETGRPAVAGMLDNALNTLREQGIDLAARAEVGTDAEGNPSVQVIPESLTLNGEALQHLLATHPALAELGDLSNGQLQLDPEHFSVSMGAEGLNVTLRNVSLSGGTDLSADSAETADQEPTRIAIDHATGSAAINSSGELQGLSLEVLSGQLSGDITLDQEVVAAIEARVQHVLGELNGYLSHYGLGRDQVQQLLSQLPGNALQQLGSSAGQSEINRLAQQFGLGNEQISGLMDLLQEQPARQLIGELSSLTDRLGENTRLSGELGFSLQDLNLRAGDSGWISSLGQLGLSLDATAEAAGGQQTAIEGHLDAEDLHLNTVQGAGGSGAISGSLSAETIAAESPAAAPTAAEQISTFTALLASGGGDYREPASGANQRSEGHLRDGHISEGGLRRGSGLHVSTAHSELVKAPATRWADMLRASDAEQQAFFAEHEITPAYGQYLLQYLDQRVLSEGVPGPDSQRLALNGTLAEAEFDPSGLSFGTVTGNASLEAESAGNQTELAISGQLAGGSIHAETSGLGPVSIEGSGHFEDAAGRVTEIAGATAIDQISVQPEASAPDPAEAVNAFAAILASGGGDYREPASGANQRSEGHLRDGHISEGGLRRGSGLHVSTAHSELIKASATRWADMLRASDAEQQAFFAEHEITPAYGQYLLAYLDRHVVNQTAEGGLHFSGIRAEGTAQATEAGSSASLQGEAGINEMRFAQDGASAENLHADVVLNSGDTQIELETRADSASANADGLSMDVDASWAFEVDGKQAQTEAHGSTTVSIVDSQITGTQTDARNLSGHSQLDQGLFLELLGEQNAGMANYFREHGILGQNNLQLNVTNTGDIRTDAHGKVTEYQLRATTDSPVSTAYGPVSASLYADDDGSITGDVLLHDPSERLAQDMQQQMRQALQQAIADMRTAGRPQNEIRSLQQAADSLQVSLSNGRFEVSLQGRQYVNFNLDLNIVPNGSTLDLTIDRVQLQNGFLDGLKDALGLNGFFNRTAANVLEQSLSNSGFTANRQGDFALSIQTRDLLGQVLGPDSDNIRIAPSFTPDGGLNIQYWIN